MCEVSSENAASTKLGPSSTRLSPVFRLAFHCISTTWQAADYVVSFDFRDVDPSLLSAADRFAVRSGDNADVAWAMMLYVLGHQPQPYVPWPKVLCTTTPQPGQ